MKTAYIAVWILTTALWWPTIVLAEGLVDPESMLSEHNAIRSQHELPPLRWSPSLAEDAAAWADHLAEQESCRMVHGESGQGENLFWASPRRWSDGRTVIQPIEPEEVVQHWAAEQAFYDYATNTCRSGEQCGHYTQRPKRSAAPNGSVRTSRNSGSAAIIRRGMSSAGSRTDTIPC